MANQPTAVPDSSSVTPSLKVTKGELAGTVPFSPEADLAAQTRTAQANPVVERGPVRRKKKARAPPPPIPPKPTPK